MTDSEELVEIVRDLVSAWDKPSGFPPQDVADLMGDLRPIVERARALLLQLKLERACVEPPPPPDERGTSFL